MNLKPQGGVATINKSLATVQLTEDDPITFLFKRSDLVWRCEQSGLVLSVAHSNNSWWISKPVIWRDAAPGIFGRMEVLASSGHDEQPESAAAALIHVCYHARMMIYQKQEQADG